MSLLQESIIYIWLIPVVLQIILPLAMLLIWTIKKIFEIQFRKSTTSQSVEVTELETLVKAA